MLNVQLVGRLFSMAGRVCLSRSSAGLGTVGPVEAAIRTKLEQALNPEVLELRNESGGHAVPPGSETHFRVAVRNFQVRPHPILQPRPKQKTREREPSLAKLFLQNKVRSLLTASPCSPAPLSVLTHHHPPTPLPSIRSLPILSMSRADTIFPGSTASVPRKLTKYTM
uniref:BolA family member 1 n=1 Tax=Lynx canadensis TaxID=61383 RepID=A0A667GSX3_LYNCA